MTNPANFVAAMMRSSIIEMVASFRQMCREKDYVKQLTQEALTMAEEVNMTVNDSVGWGNPPPPLCSSFKRPDRNMVELIITIQTVNSTYIDATWVGPESVALVKEDFCLHVLKMAPKTPSSPVKEDDFIHIYERTMKTSSFPMKNWKISDIFSPALLDRKTAFLLKYSLQCNIEPFNAEIQPYLQLISREMESSIKNASSIADRCLAVARLFGDEYDMEFWQTFKYVSKFGHVDTSHMKYLDQSFDLSEWISKSQSSSEVHDLLDLSTNDLDPQLDATKENELDSSWVNGLVKEREIFLASSAGLVMDSKDYKNYEASRLLLHNKKADSYRVKKICASRFIMLNKIAMATQVLMETETDSMDFRHDCVKACLTSCIHPTSESLGTLKLAATHLIAAGHLQDGVDLLCLIHKQADACKYMITYGNWLEAVWLAKISLPDKEQLGVICKYAEYLWQNSQKMKAVLVMMSVGQLTTVLRMLFSLGQYDTAAMFLQSCTEQRLMSQQEGTDAVYLEFAKFLIMTQCQSAIEYYCKKAGDQGHSLFQEVQSIRKSSNELFTT